MPSHTKFLICLYCLLQLPDQVAATAVAIAAVAASNGMPRFLEKNPPKSIMLHAGC